MPELSFNVEGAEPVRNAVSPHLALKLRIGNGVADEPIHNVLLQCQVRIEAPRRQYSEGDKARLLDLFGEPENWGRTLSSLLWTQTSVVVPSFTGSTRTDLPVPCTFDFNIAATRYFDALEDGEVPLCLLFSGTVFYRGEGGALQVAQVSWEQEAAYRLPVRIWREVMEQHYPNSAWLRLRKDVFDRLREHKSRCDLPTWDRAVERLLDAAGEGVSHE